MKYIKFLLVSVDWFVSIISTSLECIPYVGRSILISVRSSHTLVTKMSDEPKVSN